MPQSFFFLKYINCLTLGVSKLHLQISLTHKRAVAAPNCEHHPLVSWRLCTKAAELFFQMNIKIILYMYLNTKKYINILSIAV